MMKKVITLGFLINLAMVVAGKSMNYPLEVHTDDGNVINETISLTTKGELITTDDGNTFYYDFKDGYLVMKFNGQSNCYKLLFDKDKVKTPSPSDFNAKNETSVHVEIVHYHVEESSIVSLDTLPAEVQSMCANGNVYETSIAEDSQVEKRQFECISFCVTVTECYRYCWEY